jgi:L-fuconolactonase
LVTEADWQHWTPEQIRPYLDVVFDAFGSQRLMIGSDWPVCLIAGQYGRVMGLVKNYVRLHCSQAMEEILGGNAQRFWRLKA